MGWPPGPDTGQLLQVELENFWRNRIMSMHDDILKVSFRKRS